MRAGSWLLLSAVLLALALLFPVAGWSDELAAPSSAPSSTPNSQTFGESWRQMRQLVNDLRTESARLTNDLEALKTDSTALASSLTESRQAYASLELTLDAERQQAHDTLMIAIDRNAKAEKSRDFWRVVALIGWAAAVGVGVAAGLMAR